MTGDDTLCGEVGLLSRLSKDAPPCRISVGDEVKPDDAMVGASKPCVFIFGRCPSLSVSTPFPASRDLLTAESSMLIVGARGRACWAVGGEILPSSSAEEDMSLDN